MDTLLRSTSFVMLLCQVGIAVLLLASLFTKESLSLFAGADAPSAPRWVFDLVERAHAPTILLIVYLLLEGQIFVAIGILTLMALTGWALKRAVGARKCNCYGTLTRSGRLREWQLHGALGIMSFVVFALKATYGQAIELVSPTWLFPASLALGAAGASTLGRTEGLPKPETSAAISFAPAEQVGHLRDGSTVRLSDIAATCPMMVFIALSSNCNSCRALKPILFPITRLFASRVRVVYLVDDFVPFEAADSADVLVKGEASFIARLGGNQFPFAGVLHSGSLARIGTIAYGDAIGALLLRVLLVVLRARGSGAALPAQTTSPSQNGHSQTDVTELGA